MAEKVIIPSLWKERDRERSIGFVLYSFIRFNRSNY